MRIASHFVVIVALTLMALGKTDFIREFENMKIAQGSNIEEEQVSIIVVFKHALTDDEYAAFLEEVDKLVEPPNGSKPNNLQKYKITAVYNIALNGVAMTLPASAAAKIEKINCVSMVYPDSIIQIDPIEKINKFLPHDR